MLARKMIVAMIVVVLIFMVACTDAKVRDVKAIGEAALRKGIISAPADDYDFTKIQPGASYKPGELIVRFVPTKINGKLSGMGIAEKRSVLNSLGGATEKRSFDLVPGLSVVKLPPGLTVKKALPSFNKANDILYAQPNYEVEICSTFPNDPNGPSSVDGGDLWGMHNIGQTGGTSDADIDAPEAWDIATGSTDVIVAVIDTGVDYNHPDLAANMWVNEAEFNGTPDFDDDDNGYVDDIYGYDFHNNDGDPIDDYFHGTHCAGTIGAVGDNGVGVTGVCWNVKIMALKFLNESGFSGNIGNAIACIEYSVLMGANLSSNSWGGSVYNQGLKDAIDAAGAAGMLFVAAAGNAGYNNDAVPAYPSSYDCNSIIAVMATDHNDARSIWPGGKSSNWGPNSVDLGAPGSDILSTFPTYMTDKMEDKGFSTYYETIGGTSMATPHVAGACALLWSRNPTLSNSKVKDILLQTVDSTLSGLCVSEGRLNVFNAVLEAVTSKGYIDLDRDYYSCDSNVGISLSDSDLAGNGYCDVNLTTDGNDLETVELSEISPYIGIFTGSISTISGDPCENDGTLQVANGQTITGTYHDVNDGNGSSAEPNDTAMVDCVGPVISNLFTENLIGGKVITFQTDELATGQVICDTSCGGSSIVTAEKYPNLSHTIKLKDLEPSTNYYFEIEATDRAGNTTADSNSGNCYWFVTGEHQPVADAHQWGLDETTGTTAYDSVGDSDGYFSGGDPCWVDGLIDGAVDLDGINDYFSVPTLDAAYAYFNTFSVAGWFKTSKSTGMQTIVGQWSHYMTTPYVTIYFGWQVLVENNKVVARFGGQGPSVSDITGTSDVNDGEWHHFALVYPTKNANAVLYVDGDQEGTPGQKTCGTLFTKFRIGDGSYTYAPYGGNPTKKGGPFDGMIDNVMIFDKALSSEEVEQLCRGADPNNWWELDETTGTTAYDSVDDDDGSYSSGDPCWVDGLIGGAVDLSGISAYFSVSSLDIDYNSSDTFTVAGWFNTSQTTGMQTIVGRWCHYMTMPYVTIYSGWQVLVENKKVVARFDNGTSVSDITGTSDVNDGWHHFALVYPTSGSDAVLYVDGDQEGTPGQKTCGTLFTKFRIGDGSYVQGSGSPNMKGGPFGGTIDDLMIFRCALTADEVKQLYEATKP